MVLTKPSSSITLPPIEVASVFQNFWSERQRSSSIDFPSWADKSSRSLPLGYSEALELNAITPTSSTSRSSGDEPPKYDAGLDDEYLLSSSTGAVPTAPGFSPTKKFQIETAGHPLIALPFPPKPIPIPVYTILSTGEVGELAYTSLRDTFSSSNSCVLVRAEDRSPACITTYRFGPSRPPKLLLPPLSSPHQPVLTSNDVQCLLRSEAQPASEPIEVISDGCTTRSQTLHTPHGIFRWRYGTRTERRECSPTTSSLLILERITTMHLAGGKKCEERRRRVAQLVRSDELRTEGSTKRTAGNGGRLEVDLRDCMDSEGQGEEVHRLIVASCLVMLKKEVDRRRLHQAVILMAGASGGS
ncbi:hypothetical protein NLU13_6396 [Sarocladium strictum]|uniref:Uncharacterized protein n=1 Tax=Sarocladium strictum TaxID=5046 RepID=A0AA39GGF2_SARSR|nr:hypothetical protein NLU13_6396 [Sarocladium strictum]